MHIHEVVNDEDCLETLVLIVFDICIILRSPAEDSPDTLLAPTRLAIRRR
jgi:hypothetical protein